jgi:CheY-like chemotaxis protein
MQHTVLVIDDSMLIRHAVCRYFEQRGFATESAGDGAEALELLNSVRPDIIVTDLQMPKLDGLQLISKLKNDPRTSAIPVVVLAGKWLNAGLTRKNPGDYLIFKDIDMEGQLQLVLERVFHTAVM